MDYGSLTALVIDDQVFVRRTVSFMLRQLGISSIVEAGDGADGLKTYRTARPDIVICDIEMAPVDGLVFLETLRTEEKGLGKHPAPVLFLTSHAEADLVRKARAMGVDGFLVKPITAMDLQKRIDGLLLRARIING